MIVSKSDWTLMHCIILNVYIRLLIRFCIFEVLTLKHDLLSLRVPET